MTPDDRKPFLEVVIGFAELKGKQLSATALELYWRAMQHWSIEDFRAAAEELLRKCEFMPVPKDFEDLRKAGRVTAAEAWAQVMEFVKGAYRSGDGLDDGGPIDTAVAGLGGYRSIAFQNLDYLPIVQRQFVERFEEQVDVMDTREAVPQIASSRQQEGLIHVGRLRLPNTLAEEIGTSADRSRRPVLGEDASDARELEPAEETED